MRTCIRAFALAGVVALCVACGQNGKPVKELSPDELSKLLEQPGRVFFLDVRERYEIEQLGSVKGYKNIPASQIETRLSEVPKDKLIVTL